MVTSSSTKKRKIKYVARGNTHTIGTVRVYHADCMLAFKELRANSVDFLATDPPYFLDGMGNDWSDENLIRKSAKAGTVKGLPVGMKFDPKQGRRLQSFITEVSKEAMRVMKPGAFMVVFSQPRLFHRMAVAVEDAGFEVRDMLVWEHNGGQGKAFTQDHFVKKMNMSAAEKARIIEKLQDRKTPQLRPKFEAVLLAQKPKNGTFIQNWLKWKTGLVELDFKGEPQQSTVFNYDKPGKSEDFEHMTVKPVPLMERLIEVFSVKGQTVLDPFLGSGTTGIAAVKKGRKFIGFEIEKKYVDMSLKRFCDITVDT